MPIAESSSPKNGFVCDGWYWNGGPRELPKLSSSDAKKPGCEGDICEVCWDEVPGMKSVSPRPSSPYWPSWEWASGWSELPAGPGVGSNGRIGCPPPPVEVCEGDTCENVDESTVEDVMRSGGARGIYEAHDGRGRRSAFIQLGADRDGLCVRSGLSPQVGRRGPTEMDLVQGVVFPDCCLSR